MVAVFVFGEVGRGWNWRGGREGTVARGSEGGDYPARERGEREGGSVLVLRRDSKTV